MDPQNYVYIDERVPTTRSDGHFNMSAQEMNMLGVKNGGNNVKNGKSRNGSLIANTLSPPGGATDGVRAVVTSGSGVVSTTSASEQQQQHQGSDVKKGIIRTTFINFHKLLIQDEMGNIYF